MFRQAIFMDGDLYTWKWRLCKSFLLLECYEDAAAALSR